MGLTISVIGKTRVSAFSVSIPTRNGFPALFSPDSVVSVVCLPPWEPATIPEGEPKASVCVWPELNWAVLVAVAHRPHALDALSKTDGVEFVFEPKRRVRNGIGLSRC